MATLKVKQSDEPDERFSNSFLIGFNGYIFILDFGIVDYNGDRHVHSRIVVNPADAKEFSQLLDRALGQHTSRYGSEDSKALARTCTTLEKLV